MTTNPFQFEYDEQQNSMNVDPNIVGDIRDFLTSDLKIPDTVFNDLFDEFVLNTHGFESADSLIDLNNYSQNVTHHSSDLPPPYESTVFSTSAHRQNENHGFDNTQPVSHEYLESHVVRQLVQSGPIQQTFIKCPPTSPPTIPMPPTQYLNTSSISPQETANLQANKSTQGKRSATGKRSRAVPATQSSSGHLPKLIKKVEPIPVTLDQFQALICSTPDASTANVNSFSSLLENSTIIGNNIPLKIINQTNHNHIISDENNRHDPPTNHSSLTTGNNHLGSGQTSTGGRIRRKSSHNAIEKRYRSSINERILELKEIVADSDEKVQKSGVLRRTIEYIRRLQSVNRRLEEENSTLKTILKRLNLTNVEIPNNTDLVLPDRNPTTPPSSSGDSNESTLGSSDEAYSPVPKRQKRTTSKQGMVNGSRVILCCFMLCVLITNPFNYLLNLIHSSDYIDPTEIQSNIVSRTLKTASNTENINSSTFLSTSWHQLVAWMLNLAICFVCLIKLFVYGEPIVPESEMHEYYTYKKKADQLMSENQFNEARIYYRQCCEKLYVTIDNTCLYYFSSITWQVTRFCVNLLFLGRWLIFWSGWTKSIDTRDYNRELNDCLLQLWKIEYQNSTSLLSIFNLFISTINTSMNSGKKLDIIKRNEIYILTALTFKKFNGLFHIFIPYILKYLSLNDIHDLWLADIDRLTQFIFDKKKIILNGKNSIDSIRLQYFQYILYDNIKSHLLFQDDTQIQQQLIIKNQHDLNYFSWWQHTLQVIRCISNDKQSIDHILSSDLLRQTDKSNQTIYDMARTMNIADHRYIHIVETIHSILLVLHDDDDQTRQTRISLLDELGESSRIITSIIEDTIHENNDDECLDLAIKTCLLDGILSLRLRLLTSTITNNIEKLPNLSDFQKELDNYKQLNRIMKLPKERFYLFESIYRVSCGINPLKTQTLFECAVKQQNSTNEIDIETVNLDIMAALLLFCHFLPSTVYYYRNLLQQAANISSVASKNNDLYRLQQQCLSLIRQPFYTL